MPDGREVAAGAARFTPSEARAVAILYVDSGFEHLQIPYITEDLV